MSFIYVSRGFGIGQEGIDTDPVGLVVQVPAAPAAGGRCAAESGRRRTGAQDSMLAITCFTRV
ncbi:hypothetical protein GCM10027039_17300 [Terrabacter koreensis]